MNVIPLDQSRHPDFLKTQFGNDPSFRQARDTDSVNSFSSREFAHIDVKRWA
jgi:hypothetical protein